MYFMQRQQIELDVPACVRNIQPQSALKDL